MEKVNRAATTRDSEKYIVRFPEGMRDRVTEAAKASNRTMNAEIISRLQQSFGGLEPGETAALKLEIESLRAQAEGRQEVGKVLEVTQGFLSAMLVKVIDQLPEPTRSHYVNVRALAEGIETGDSRKMGAAMMVLFESDPTAVRVLAETMEDLEPSIAARERGDDVAPFREDALNKLHQRREADAERARQATDLAQAEPEPEKPLSPLEVAEARLRARIKRK